MSKQMHLLENLKLNLSLGVFILYLLLYDGRNRDASYPRITYKGHLTTPIFVLNIMYIIFFGNF